MTDFDSPQAPPEYPQDEAAALVYARAQVRLLALAAQKHGIQVCVAESCTGGLLGSLVTEIPGASEWFVGGVIAYANRVKEDLLGVPSEVLEDDGAVSAACAEEMAMGAIQVTGASLGIAITGIAGPAGGNRLKPVGTVFLAVISDQNVLGDRLRIPPINRAYIRLVSVGRAAALALEALDENR